MESKAQQPIPVMAGKKSKYQYSAYLYLFPAGIIILVFHILPIFYTLGLSFFRQAVPEPASYVGLYNYNRLFSDAEFFQALRNTVYYVIGTIPTGIILALLIALLLNSKIKGLGFYRVLYFLPVVTAINAVALVWKWLYHPQNYGLLNYLKNLFYQVCLAPVEKIFLTGGNTPSAVLPWFYVIGVLAVLAAVCWSVYGIVSRMNLGIMRLAFFLFAAWLLGKLAGFAYPHLLACGLEEFQKQHIVMVLLIKVGLAAFALWALIKLTTRAEPAWLTGCFVLLGVGVFIGLIRWASSGGLGSTGNWLNEFFSFFEEKQDYLNHPKLAMPAIMVMSIWKGLGHNVIIFLAGLQNVPAQLYEAAKIDGAGAWGRFRHITWPLISPTTFFVLIMSTIGSFQVFAQVYMMTPTGGPLGSTKVIVFYLYQKAFAHFEMGYSAAVALVLFAIIMTMTILQRTFLEKKVHYA